MHKTLAEDAEDWLDRTVDSRRYLGQSGTTVAEQVGHIGASAVFGFLYGTLQRSVPGMPPLVLGSLYGGTLYAVNIAGVAPLIGLTRGEGREPLAVVLERLGLRLLFGVAVAGFMEMWERSDSPSICAMRKSLRSNSRQLSN